MELDMIKRGLRAEIKKREKETYATCQTNVRDMCTDVLSKLEEQEKEIAELKARIHDLESIPHTDNSAVIARLEEELRNTQRALWLARSFIMTLLQRDFQRLAYQCNSTEYKKNLLEKRNCFYDLSVKFSAKAKEYADNVLMEEVAEAFNAYQKGDKAQALHEFAQ